MKIVFLHTDFRLYWKQRLCYLHNFLAEHGHNLEIIEIAGKGSNYDFSQQKSLNETWWSCLFPGNSMEKLGTSTVAWHVRKKLKECRPDIVFAGAIAYPSGANAISWCRMHHKPVVIFDDARRADVKRSIVVDLIKFLVYKNVDAVLIPAPSFRADYEKWGFSREQIAFGIDVIDNDYWKNLAEIALPLHNFPKRYILGVGRQVAKKNWSMLIRAYAQANIPESLVLIGNGDERGSILQTIRDHALQDRVYVLDFKEPAELARYYKTASAVILPSLWGETWGLTINEAMACGTPVLVSQQCGCCTTLCLDGNTGISFEPTLGGITTALQAFSALSSDEQKRMRKNAQAHIAQWGLDALARSVLQLTEKLTLTNRGFADFFSAIVTMAWKGRYRPL